MGFLRLCCLFILLQRVWSLDVEELTATTTEFVPACRGEEEHLCGAGGIHHQCINEYWICDGHDDCNDGQDEDEEYCQDYHENRICRPDDEFACPSNNRCIPKEWLCDGKPECSDGADELHCDTNNKCMYGQYNCRDGGNCVSMSLLCDGVKDCHDGSDEHNCTADCPAAAAFMCSDNLRCPPLDEICDGKPDCKDGSDEGGRCDDRTCSLPCSNGKCVKSPQGPFCDCLEGYESKGADCKDIDECNVESHCDHYCQNTAGGYTCICRSDYKLHGKEICKVEDSSSAMLLYAYGKDVMGLYMDTNVAFRVYSGDTETIAVAYDPNTKMVYWSDSKKRVFREPLNNDDAPPQLILDRDIGMIHDIAMDWFAHNVYLADKNNQRIVVCNVDNLACKNLLTQPTFPTSIKLDIERRRMYWTDTEKKQILVANMDGSDRKILAQGNLIWPNALAIDNAAERLYWADAKHKVLEIYDLKRFQRKIIPAEEIGHPYSMALWEDRLYWSDWDRRAIVAVHKIDGLNMTTIHKGTKHFVGISIYHRQMMKDLEYLPNNCLDKAGCSHLCLQTSVLPFYRCECPKEMEMSGDGKTCVELSHVPMLVVGIEGSIYKVEIREFSAPLMKKIFQNDKFTRISDLDYDPIEGDLFVSDQAGHKIVRINVESGTSSTILSGLKKPAGIAVDWSRRNLYWVDSFKKSLEASTLSGRYRTELPLNQTCRALDVAVHQRKGSLIISCGSPNARILSCSRAGAPCTVLADTRIQVPIGLAVDQRSLNDDAVYWTDYHYNTVERASLTTKKRIEYSALSPAAILVSNGKLYYTVAGNFQSVFKTNKFNLNSEWETLPLRNSQNPMDGRLSRQRGHVTLSEIGWKSEDYELSHSYQSFCEYDKQKCQHLCLEKEGQRVCACSPTSMLASDGVTCVAKQCSATEHLCLEDGLCIPDIFKCDGVDNCLDRSDETSSDCKECHVESYHCQSGDCVPQNKVCDGMNDCDDNSDELNCYESKCSEGFTACDDGQVCYASVLRCDGSSRCQDLSDELDCPACPSATFKCADGRGLCLSNNFLCNGVIECIDGSDEVNCTKACPPEEFQCGGTIVQCLPRAKVCDSGLDCPNGEDEELEVCFSETVDCNPSDQDCSVICQNDEFQCQSDLKCIKDSLKCDGTSNCADASDERSCPVIFEEGADLSSDCGRGMFNCGDSCIDAKYVCDSVLHCANGADEDGECGTTCSRNNGGCEHNCTETPMQPQCFCYSGYKLNSDGRHCHDQDECGPGNPCEQYCSNTEGSFRCSCAAGYQLLANSVNCGLKSGLKSKLALINGTSLRWIGASNTRDGAIIIPSGKALLKIAYDDVKNKMFTIDSDDTLGVITPHNLKWAPIIGLERPTAVAVDGRGGNVYVGQALVGQQTMASNLLVCGFRSNVCKIIFEKDDVTIADIAVAGQARRLFFCDNGISARKSTIYQTHMDGSSIINILSINIKGCSSISLDEPKELIYWIDPLLNQIFSATWSGSSRTLYKTLKFPGNSLTTYGGWVQWLQIPRSLQRCSKFNSDHCKNVQLDTMATDLAVVSGQRMNESRMCLSNTCKYICVPGDAEAVCLCDDIQDESCIRRSVRPSVTSCDPDPCEPGGDCILWASGGYTCECHLGYKGEHCHVTVKSIDKEDTYTTPLVVVTVLLVIVAIAAGLYYYYKRPLFLLKRKNTSKSQVRFSNPAFGAPKDEIDTALRSTSSGAEYPQATAPEQLEELSSIHIDADNHLTEYYRNPDSDSDNDSARVSKSRHLLM